MISLICKPNLNANKLFQIEKFAQRSATKKGPPQSNVKGNRLELFLAVASVVSVTIALLLVLTRAFTSYNFFLAFLAISFYISLLSAHFQVWLSSEFPIF
jgi:hypothetical protein